METFIPKGCSNRKFEMVAKVVSDSLAKWVGDVEEDSFQSS